MSLPDAQITPRIKICGLTRPEDALLALDLGADFLGIIMTPKSPRHLTLKEAEALVQAVRDKSRMEPRFFGVFVDEDPELMAASFKDLKLTALQVHGNTDDIVQLVGSDHIIPALKVKDSSISAEIEKLAPAHPAILTDAFSEGKEGGTGKVFNHELVQPLFAGNRIFVAGGIHHLNIESIIERLKPGPLPYAFDLSSGIESEPRIKSHPKMKTFFDHYRRALESNS